MKKEEKKYGQVQPTQDELDAIQYITAQRLIDLRNKYTNNELALLYAQAHNAYQISELDKELAEMHSPYKYYPYLLIILCLISWPIAYFYNKSYTLHITVLVPLVVSAFINLYVVVAGFGVIKWVKSFFTDVDYYDPQHLYEEIKSNLYKFYARPDDVGGGHWYRARKVAKELLTNTKWLLRLCEDEGIPISHSEGVISIFLCKKNNNGT